MENNTLHSEVNQPELLEGSNIPITVVYMSVTDSTGKTVYSDCEVLLGHKGNDTAYMDEIQAKMRDKYLKHVSGNESRLRRIQ